MKKIITLLFLISCGGYSSDKNITNSYNDSHNDSHDQGIQTCKADCSINKDGEVVLGYYSFNGGVCAEKVIESLDLCKAAEEKTPEIQIDENDINDAQDSFSPWNPKKELLKKDGVVAYEDSELLKH